MNVTAIFEGAKKILMFFSVLANITPEVCMRINREGFSVQNNVNDRIFIDASVIRRAFKKFNAGFDGDLFVVFGIENIARLVAQAEDSDTVTIFIDKKSEENVDIVFKIGKNIVYREKGMIKQSNWEVSDYSFLENFKIKTYKMRNAIISASRVSNFLRLAIEDDFFVVEADTAVEYLLFKTLPEEMDRKSSITVANYYDSKELKKMFSKSLEFFSPDIQINFARNYINIDASDSDINLSLTVMYKEVSE